MTHQPTRDVLSQHQPSSLTSSRGKGRKALSEIPNVSSHLLEIALADDCEQEVRFKAFESYFELASQTPDGLPDDAARAAMASVYAGVLASGTYPNRWGLPYDVTSSATSRRLMALGEHATRKLVPILDDDRPLPYEGSEEATIASMHRLRYKDLAAGLLAAMRAVPFPDQADPARRDATIAALRATLK
jgi:hypothetical protein